MKRKILVLGVLLCLLTGVVYAQFGGEGAFGSVRGFLRRINVTVKPAADNTYDLGSSTKEWKDIHVDGIGYIDSITSTGGITLSDGAVIDQSADNYVTITENDDTLEAYFGGADVDLLWSDGALNLRNAEDGVDAIVEIEGKDANEKGILRVLSDGDDKYVELYHDDTDSQIVSSSGKLILTGKTTVDIFGATDATDTTLAIYGKDANEKGILAVYSDGDDKSISVYHDDTDGVITVSSGAISLDDKDLDDVGGIALDSLTAEDGTGPILVNDDLEFQNEIKALFGTASEWQIEYDEDGDDQLLVHTTKVGTAAVNDPMYEILVDFGTADGTGMTAFQEVFGVSKGTQASNIPLFAVDEDGNILLYNAVIFGPDATGNYPWIYTSGAGIPSGEHLNLDTYHTGSDIILNPDDVIICSDKDIEDVGDIALDSISPDGTDVSITIGAGTLGIGDGTYSWGHSPMVGIEGILEVDGASYFDGTATFNNTTKINDGKFFVIGTGTDITLYWDLNSGSGHDMLRMNFGNAETKAFVISDVFDAAGITTFNSWLSPTLVITNTENADSRDFSAVIMGERAQSDVEVVHYFDFYAMTGADDGSVDGTTAELGATFRFGDSPAVGTVYTGAGDVIFNDNVELQDDTAILDDKALIFGSGSDVKALWETAEATDALHLLLDATGKNLVIGDIGSLTHAFDHGASSNPTVFIHSVLDPDNSNSEYASLTHDALDVTYSSGFGGYSFEVDAQPARGTITLADVPTAEDTFVINNTTVTAKTSGATGDQFNIGVDAPATVTNIVTCVNAGTEASNVHTYDGAGDTVVFEWLTKGTAGNTITFTESLDNATIDGGGTLGGTHTGVVADVIMTLAEAGGASFEEFNISNVGDIAVDTITADGGSTIVLNDDVHIGADDATELVEIHDAGTLKFWDLSDDSSVIMSVSTNGSDDLSITGDVDVSGYVHAGTLQLSGGSILDTSTAISFGDENLSTSGTFGSGNATIGTLVGTEFPAVGTDPDVDAAGEIGRDSDDNALRGFDTLNQYVYGMKKKNINVTIAKPLSLDEADTLPIFENRTQFNYVITAIFANSDTDDTVFTLKETTDLRDFSALTTIEAITIAINGTSVFYEDLGQETIAFTSGGTAAIAVGDVVTCVVGGETAIVEGVSVLSGGSWGGGDAAGTLYLSSVSGVFQAGELTTPTQANIATVGGDASADIDHTVIEPMHGIVFDNDAADDPDYINFTIVGYYDGDIS